MSEFVPEEFDTGGVKYTPRKTVLRGIFQLSRAAVPYYAANVELDQISKKELKLVEEMPADYRANWTLEELFQRDLDRERVARELVTGYLKRKEKRTFFNSLTVALLPRTEDGKLDSEYGDVQETGSKEGPFGHPEYITKNIGGIQLATKKGDASDVAYLRWDETRVFPATIDGQHRLKALREFLEDAPLTAEQLRTRIPVLFLILDERVGFKQTDQPDLEGRNPLLTVVREIFIDLNKHAIEVSQARQILLNDQEIESVCTRALLAERVGESTDDELPLGIVNWQTDKVKFDEGPHLTTVTGLYQVIREILDVRYPIKDPADPKLIRRFLDSLENALEISEQLKREDGVHASVYRKLKPLKEFVEENYLNEDGVPFRNVPQGYVWAAKDAFCRLYKPLIIQVLREHTPYREFWKKAAELGSIDGDLAYYLGQPEHQRKVLEEEYGHESYRDKIKQLSDLKKNRWAFMVVFQKALLIGSFEAQYQADIVLGEGVSRENFATKWLDFLNACYLAGLFNMDFMLDGSTPETTGEFWEGIAKNPVSRTIKYSNAAARRIRELVRLGWYYNSQSDASSREFLIDVTEKGSEARWPGGRQHVTHLRRALQAVARAKGIEDQSAIEQFGDVRLVEIVSHFGVNRFADRGSTVA